MPVPLGLFVMTRHNHAYQKLFPFTITHPHLLLPLLLPCIPDQHVIKLHFPILAPIVWYDIKLQPHPDLA
jgi:hypothetical protein